MFETAVAAVKRATISIHPHQIKETKKLMMFFFFFLCSRCVSTTTTTHWNVMKEQPRQATDFYVPVSPFSRLTL